MIDSKSYYAAVADRMVPFVVGRRVAIEQRFRSSDTLVFRRHQGTGANRDWIFVREPGDIIRWAKQHTVAFHTNIKPEGGGAWFLLDIDARDLPLEMARIGALYALDAIDEVSLTALVKYSGSNGFHLMWNMPDLRLLGGKNIWEFERDIVQAIADYVEPKLARDPRADPIRNALGSDGKLISTTSADTSHAERCVLLFDKLILKDNANVRVPYSLHPKNDSVSVPLSREDLEQFDDSMSDPDRVAHDTTSWRMPDNVVRDVKQALEAWKRGTN
jgi:DNA primase